MSLHDPDARPIRKGRLGKPVEFGYKAQVVDNDDGIVLDRQLEKGNPPDAPSWPPPSNASRRRTGRPPGLSPPTAATAKPPSTTTSPTSASPRSCIPRKGRPSAARRPSKPHAVPTPRPLAHRREGRISCLKRDFGWRRTRMDTLAGARTWTGHGILAHNLTKIAALTT